MAPKFKEGEYVWVKDASIAGSRLYTKGHIQSINGNKVTVETSNDVKTQELVLPLTEIFKVNPDVDMPDHCQLMHLSQPTLLENTRKRFERDVIYTFVGEILVAVNPYHWIKDLYGPEVMAQARGKKIYNSACGPHPYVIGEKAYNAMRKAQNKEEINQCIVVSGESGAGKTECNKQLMNYLVWRGSDEQSMHKLTKCILDMNPILESFGNAKTTRNNNSSRFGRYVLVQFSEINEVVGAEIRTFLLERSRVTSTTSANERSYHVLYQVATSFAECKLPLNKLHYLSMSGTTTVNGMNDLEHFQQTNSALLTLGVDPSDVNEIWSFVTAMLYLGNITFGDGDTAQVMNTDVMRTAERLLGCESFQELLVRRVITTRGESTYIDHTPQQASLARDSLVKVMYDRLFSYLVGRVNETVNNSKEAKRTIGLLDVYGFEFFQVNSFEQLCINFANEKLQQYFLEVVFTGEERTYKDEGVPWTPIPYTDNSPIISLLESPADGVYVTLDSQSRTPNASGRTFCQQLYNIHTKSKVFGPPKLSRNERRTSEDHFVVKHFAGDVVYCCDEFLEKNSDSLPREFEAALMASKKELVRLVSTPQAVQKTTSAHSSFGSVGSKFVKSLKQLMVELHSSTAHFVRCIKPNKELVPGKLDGESVVNQLRLNGTLDAVRLIQAGYPTRIPYEIIYSRYRDMMPPQVQSLPPPQFCEVIAEVCGVGKSEYYLGVTRMFFKLGAAAILEELSDADPEAMKPILLEKLRLFEQMKESKPRIENDLRMWLVKRRYTSLLVEKRRREEEERRKEEERRRKEEERKRKEEEKRKRAEEEARRRAEEEEKRRKEAEDKAKNQQLQENAKMRDQEVEAASRMLSEIESMIQALEEDADLEEAVHKAGGVRALIAMSQKHADSAMVQAQFAGVLRDLCISDEIALDISAEQGVEAIIEAARCHYDSVEVQVAVAGALRNLSELDQIALDISRLGGIEALVDASARHPEHPEVQARVAGALWGLSVHDDVAEMIIDSGGADALIASAKSHPNNAELQASTAGAVRNLSVSDDNKHCIADIDGVEVLISASDNHLDNALVQAQVAGALRNLSLNDEVAEHIAESGGIEALVGASNAHENNAKVQAGVAGALRNLSVNDEIAEEIANAGGIEALVIASKEHPNNSDVQAEVAGALWGLSVNDEVEEAIALANGVQILVSAATNHLKNAKVQARVAGALRKLSANDDNKHEIANCGGIEMLIRSSRVHIDNAVVQAGVAGALSNLSVDDDIEQSIASEGGIEALIEASNAHAGNVKVQARVVRALTNLSVHDKNKEVIASRQGVKTLIQASQQHADSAEVQAGVAGALRNLSVSPEIAAVIVANNAIVSLIRASQHHTTNAIVQAGVAGALRNLSVLPQNRQIILDANGVDALLLAAQIHSANEKLQKEVAGALRNLETPMGDANGHAPSADSVTSEVPPQSNPPATSKGNNTSRRSLGSRNASPRGSRNPLGSPLSQSSSKRDKSPKPGGEKARSKSPGSGTFRFGGLSGGLSRRRSSSPRGSSKGK